MYPCKCRTERWRGGPARRASGGAGVEGSDAGSRRVGMTARAPGEERSGASEIAREGTGAHEGADSADQSEEGMMGPRCEPREIVRGTAARWVGPSWPILMDLAVLSSRRASFPGTPTTRARRRESHPPPTLYAPTLPPPPSPSPPPPLPLLADREGSSRFGITVCAQTSTRPRAVSALLSVARWRTESRRPSTSAVTPGYGVPRSIVNRVADLLSSVREEWSRCDACLARCRYPIAIPVAAAADNSESSGRVHRGIGVSDSGLECTAVRRTRGSRTPDWSVKVLIS